jgi:hypothetical protein
MVLLLVVTCLGLPTIAKADAVRFNLTNTAFDLSSGRFTLFGSFTNSGSVAFTANRFDVVFTPDLRPLEIRAVDTSSPDCCNYTQTVPGMSTSAVLPMLEFIFIGPPVLGPGIYNASLTFSGVAGSDLNVVTAPVQFTICVPANLPEVPEPTAMLLLSTGLLAVGAAVRRRRRVI